MMMIEDDKCSEKNKLDQAKRIREFNGAVACCSIKDHCT